MTKQYLVAFAADIRHRFNLAHNPTPVEQLGALAAMEIVCEVARQFNPRFDEARFRAACVAE